ncbi:uncharacterized protein LOC104928834 isoform X1 [Larimichthys crocea]|uniref:uncharacterized protein LOC104928834 isoform X1 n=1 Tax=Larimichthys crocea TaxID=215358 RepID=UPI000F5FC128|nr:uncharacterized protein LOC104928834 isoform X1 [Larimichthys crocea]XP_019116861.2 uncharacterized protein LOC104928834 isoform X1 [Larimichthys crocea]
MGQLQSSEEELSQVKDAIGSLLYDAMLEAGAVPHLGVVHPVLLANHDERFNSRAGLQEQLQQLQGDIGKKAPTYLKDLIGRLSAFSDEPRLAGLVGLVVTMVMDMAYTSSKSSSAVKGKSAGSSSSQQRVWELQEVMEEYLKRCRINLNEKNKLIQDSIRLEAQLSLTLTQLKTCLLGGDCNSRCLRHWASGAAFNTQMLVHLAGLEGKAEPLAARAALEQYKEDLTQIIPAYRRYKSSTVCVVKCRGGLLASRDPSSEAPEEGSMTGLTVTDRETGKSVTIPLSTMETETGRRVSGPDNTSATMSSAINLDLITSDQYAQAYLDRFFSDKGPVAELKNYFTMASDKLRTLRTQHRCKNKTEATNVTEQSDGVQPKDRTEGVNGKQAADRGKGDKQDETDRRGGGREEAEEREQRGERLKLSIVETQPDESLDHSLHGATSSRKS